MLELIFLQLLEISLQASIFIAAILLLRVAFKKMPKNTLCILWLLVGLRLVLPIEITSSFSLIPDTSGIQKLSQTSYVPAKGFQSQDGTHYGSVIIPDSPGQQDTSDPDYDYFEPSQIFNQDDSTDTISGASQTPAAKAVSVSAVLAFIWSIGALALAGYGIFSYNRTRYHLREAVHDRDNIWLSEHIESPFVLGYVKPRIYMPYTIEETQLPYIIAHEKAHIAHFDHIAKLAGYMLLCVYWFNPVIWLGYLTFCKDLELACDERVIQSFSTSDRKSYSEALLFNSVSNYALLKSPLSFAEVSVKERITNILHYKKPGFFVMAAAFLACVAGAVCFMTTQTVHDKTAAEKTQEFLAQITLEDLTSITEQSESGHTAEPVALPQSYTPDAVYLLDSLPDEGIFLYGLCDGSAMIFRDRDSFYPVDAAWTSLETPSGSMPVLKSQDYNLDGIQEYTIGIFTPVAKSTAVTKLVLAQSGEDTYRFTILEAGSDFLKDFRERIVCQYDQELSCLHITAGLTSRDCDTTYWNRYYNTTFTNLQIEAEEVKTIFQYADDMWWVYAFSGYTGADCTLFYEDAGVLFSAPLIYNTNGSFSLGDISISQHSEKPDFSTKLAELETNYGDQLDKLPGKVTLDEYGNYVLTLSAKDYECVIGHTEDNTPIYRWAAKASAKQYPLELTDGVLKEVSAQVLSESELLKKPYGKDLKEFIDMIFPMDIKQYILRDNGTLYVNIGYEDAARTFLNLRYVEFYISSDGTTATFNSNGNGCQLLYANDVSSLEAFRKAFTGDDHVLPADCDLPWDWLLAANNEKTAEAAGSISADYVPVVEHCDHFDQMIWDNIHNYYNDFTLYETCHNGVLCPAVTYRDAGEDVTILFEPDINRGERVILLHNHTETQLDIDGFFLGGAASYGYPYMADLTGDGKKELIFVSSGGGTGVRYSWTRIYNMDTLEEIPIDLDITSIINALDVEVIHNKDEKDFDFMFTYKDQSFLSTDNWISDYESLLDQNGSLKTDREYFSIIYYSTVGFEEENRLAYNLYYDEASGCLKSTVYLSLEDLPFLSVSATLDIPFVYDAQTNTFLPDGDAAGFDN